MSTRSLKQNFALNSAYQILLILTPIVTAPYLARVLGPSQNGVFTYTQSAANYFVLFATLGMSTYGVRLIALCGNDRVKRSRAFWSAYGAQLLVGVVVLFAYLIYIISDPRGGAIIAALWMPWVAFAVLDATWLFFGVEEFKIPTVRSAATKLISVLIIFAFVKNEGDLWIYVLSISGSFFVNALAVLPFIGRFVDFYIPTFQEIMAHFLPNLSLFVPVVAVSLYTTLDKIMLGAMSSMDQVSYFEYAERISRMPLSVITALGTVMMPRMSATIADGRHDEALKLLEISIWFMLACAFAFAFGVAAVAPIFVPVFFGPGYEGAIAPMILLSVIIPIISTTNVIGRQYLLPANRDRDYTISLIIGAIVNIVVNLTLIPKIGAMGTAIGTVAAESSILITQALMVWHALPLKKYAQGALPFAAIGILMYSAIRFAQKTFIVPAMGATATSLIILVLFGAQVYVMAALIWCIATNNNEFNMLFGKYASRMIRR